MTSFLSFRRGRRGRRAALTVTSLGVGLALVVSACGSSSPTNGQSANAQSSGSSSGVTAGNGGVLKVAMSAGNIPIPDVAPDQGYEGYRFVGNNVYDGLTKLNLDQATSLPTPQPALATSWTVSPNKLTWTFNLRQGVTFQDGTPFNADAVIFNMERDDVPTFKYFDQIDSARLSTYFAHIKSFQKLGPYQISITTTEPYAFLPYDLLTIFFASPTQVMKLGNTAYVQHPIGTGPFMVTKYVNDVTMTLTANLHYWGGAPKLAAIELFPEPEDASRLASLESGAVNWAEVPSPDSISELKSQGYQVFMDDHHPGAIMPLFNLFKAPMRNLDVREALNYAVNRAATVAVINGTGLPASQYVQPGSPYYIPNDPGFTYDPAKAKALLAQAGYGPGHPLNLTMAYPPNGSGNMFPEPMMEELQSSFKAVGVNLTITPIEWDTFLTMRTSGGMSVSPWNQYDIMWSSPAAGMLPTGYTYSFLCQIGGIKNSYGYCDPKVDAAYNAAAASFNPTTQDQDIQELEKVLQDDSQILYWVNDRNLRVMAPTVHGYVNAWSWWVDFTKITVS